MQMMHDDVFGIYPNNYMQLRSPLIRFPTLFNVTGDSVVGNGSGSGRQAMEGAFGEYIERFHFYNEVDINITSKLAELNSTRLVDKLIYQISQIKKVPASVAEHPFDLTEVENVYTAQKSYLPSVMFSLAHPHSPDRDFIPFIDSCGQAVHISREKASSAALKEFIERQALIGAWLSGLYRFNISLESYPLLGQSNSVLVELQQHGVLLAYELNKCLPGYSVIIFYFSHSEKDIVKYSVGMASDFSPVRAVERALNELWQSYMFMYLSTDNPEALDKRYRYLNDLIRFNNHDTRKLIPFVDTAANEICLLDFMDLPEFSKDECLTSLADISHDVYAYERANHLFGRHFHFCKIVSPDFYLHMGIKMPLNFDNLYAQKIGVSKQIEIHHAIPFP